MTFDELWEQSDEETRQELVREMADDGPREYVAPGITIIEYGLDHTSKLTMRGH